jgi:hypothetical protein
MKRFLGFVASKLDGHKTKIGGMGLIMLGLAGIISHTFPSLDLPLKADLEIYLTYLASGFTAIGIGGKLEKNTKAVIARGKRQTGGF